MPRKVVTLDGKIEQAQAEVFRLKDKYDAAVEELNRLQKKKQELQRQELLQAIEASQRTYDEIMVFLTGNAEEDGNEHDEQNV